MARETAQDYRDRVAQVIIEALEKGVAPWQKSWDAAIGLPHNPVSALRNGTNGRYRGGNTIYLQVLQIMNGMGDPRWVTFNQASRMRYGTLAPLSDREVEQNKALKWDDPARIRTWQIRKGSKGVVVEKWGTVEKTVTMTSGEEEQRTQLFWKPYVVFNAEQIDGIPSFESPALKLSDAERHRRAEAIFQRSGAVCKLGSNAYYTPSLDTITMPPAHAFRSLDDYYETKFHELGHWTGHASRLNRDLRAAAASNSLRAEEELRAEIGSMILSQELGLPHNVDRHAAYVGSWLEALRNDPHEIFAAARDAQKIADFVMAFDLKLELDPLKSPSNVDDALASMPGPQLPRKLALSLGV